MPSGKRRVHSVSGRHRDDRWRNAFDVFRKAYIPFYFRSLPSTCTHGNCRSEYRHRTTCSKVHYTPFTSTTRMCRDLIGFDKHQLSLRTNFVPPAVNRGDTRGPLLRRVWLSICLSVRANAKAFNGYEKQWTYVHSVLVGYFCELLVTFMCIIG